MPWASTTANPSLNKHTTRQHIHPFLNGGALGAWQLPSEEYRKE